MTHSNLLGFPVRGKKANIQPAHKFHLVEYKNGCRNTVFSYDTLKQAQEIKCESEEYWDKADKWLLDHFGEVKHKYTFKIVETDIEKVEPYVDVYTLIEKVVN